MMTNNNNNENAKPTSNAVAIAGISPVLHSSKPSTVLVNSWNETRQVRAMLDQCRRDKAFVETQLSNETEKTERLERENSELHDENAMLRAHLAAFETENPLPPGWVRRVTAAGCVVNYFLFLFRHCYCQPSFLAIFFSQRSTQSYFVPLPTLCTTTQERIFSDSQQRYFYSHAATKHSQWHYPTASEVRDPTIAKRRVEQNQQDAHHRRLS